MIRALLRHHPEERITSEDLLHHPWLTKENFRETVRSCSDQLVPMCAPKRRRRTSGSGDMVVDMDESQGDNRDGGDDDDVEDDEHYSPEDRAVVQMAQLVGIVARDQGEAAEDGSNDNGRGGDRRTRRAPTIALGERPVLGSARFGYVAADEARRLRR